MQKIRTSRNFPEFMAKNAHADTLPRGDSIIWDSMGRGNVWRPENVWFRSGMVLSCSINYQKFGELMFGEIITKKLVFTSAELIRTKYRFENSTANTKYIPFCSNLISRTLKIDFKLAKTSENTLNFRDSKLQTHSWFQFCKHSCKVFLPAKYTDEGRSKLSTVESWIPLEK